ncbi:MAG: fibronectin type III domain-containing protein [Saprospiraceae bacterium]|nr:fibronectin type III domain-containing protein [Saprospiraceae bacterium]
MKRRLHTIPLFLLAWLLAAAGAWAQIPVANYSFTGNAQDFSASNNHATVHGATPTQDRFGWANAAFLFDGAQSFIQAPNAAALNSDYTTVCFWIKVTELPIQGEAYLLSFGGWQERWKISLPPHGKLVWTTNNSSGISDMDAGDANALSPGAWKHLAFVHNGTKDLIYINGVQVAEKNVSGTMSSTARPLGIGYNPIDKGNYFKGALDEVVIFDNALNATEIAAFYAAQNTAPSVSQTLVADYGFRNNALDATVFHNHAQATDVQATTDRFGYGNNAFRFNGISSEVTASNSAQLNSPYTTVSFWVKPNTLPVSGEAFLLSFGGWQERFKMSLPSHGKVVWTTNNSSGISDMDAGGGHELKPGVWSHIVAVHDGTNDKIFIDGALASSKAVAGTMNSTAKPLGIGYNAVDGGNWFDGVLDDVQLFNFALDDAAVGSLYVAQNTFPGTATDLVAAYSFAGNGDDATQFGNHAAVGGAQPTIDRFNYASNAYHFSGADSLLAANSVQYNSDYTTISFWVKPDELPVSGEAYLLSNGGWQERWKISLPGHGKPVFTTNYATGISDMDSGGGNELPVGQWRHVVMVHDGVKDKIFINGVLANSKDVVGKLNSTKQPLGIGNNPIDAGNYFKGSLDDIQLYNRALSDPEVAALFAAQNAAPNIPDDLVANYTFDGDANDETPFHNHAQASGAQLGNDRFAKANQAYAFNGVSDEILAANSPQLNSDFTTVCFWVNVKALPASGEAFLLSNGGWQERWKISLPAHGKVVWTTNNTSGISDMDAGDGNALPVGAWTHVALVHDGAKDKIFINGVAKAEKAVTGALNSSAKPLGMGYNPIDQGNCFNCSLDEVQIYKKALSDAEIAALYAAQATPPAVTDAEAPTAPLNLAATVEFNNVGLSWWASTDNVGVSAYNLYQNGAKILSTGNTSAYLPGLTAQTLFTFGVSAVDAAGNESLPTTLDVTTLEEATPDVTPPSVPGNLMAATGANSVLLSWQASTDDRGVRGYVILVDGVLFDTVTNTSVLVTGLDPETPYTFEVYAFDKAGNNSAIAELTVSTDKEIDTGEPGLVAHYPFEGNANDATPYANHGVIGGNPVFEPATHPNGGGQNIKFDGQGDSILAPNAVQLISDFTTVSFWIRVDDQNFDDAEAYVLDFGHWSERWKISLPQHLKIVWTTNGNNLLGPIIVSDMDSGDGNEMTKGFWWHVTMVHDGANDIVYVNGEQANIKPVTTKLNSTGLPLGMGNNPVEGGQFFIGGLDEVKIYNKALTAAEIAKLYSTGTTGTEDLNADLFRMLEAVYPNPATDRLWIKHRFEGNQALYVRVFDVEGRQVGDLRFDKNQIPDGQFAVPVSQYPTGTYFLNFVLGGKNIGSVKFDKQ